MSYRESEYLYPGVEILRATRTPCPVCGHPTGDCHPGEWYQRPTRRRRDDVFLEQDVIEERALTPKRKTKIIVEHGGTWISRRRAKELGIV